MPWVSNRTHFLDLYKIILEVINFCSCSRIKPCLMRKTKFILKFCLPALVAFPSLHAGYSNAQQLSQDPLYTLVFEDNFDTIHYDLWNTHCPWGNNQWNSNFAISCDSNHFPGRIVDVAFNSQPLFDTNRIIVDSGGVSFERMIFDRRIYSAILLPFIAHAI